MPGAAGSATKATAGRRAKPRVSGWRVTPGSARRSTRRTGSAASSFGRVDAHSRRQPWLLWGSRRHGRGVPGRPLTTRPSTGGARATRPARREIVGRGEEQPGAPRLHRPRPPPRRSVLRGADPPSGRGEPQTGAVWAPRVPGAPAAALGEHTVLCCCQRQPPKRAEAASACQALAPLPAGGVTLGEAWTGGPQNPWEGPAAGVLALNKPRDRARVTRWLPARPNSGGSACAAPSAPRAGPAPRRLGSFGQSPVCRGRGARSSNSAILRGPRQPPRPRARRVCVGHA